VDGAPLFTYELEELSTLHRPEIASLDVEASFWLTPPFGGFSRKVAPFFVSVLRVPFTHEVPIAPVKGAKLHA
jgi:hypothetical protein